MKKLNKSKLISQYWGQKVIVFVSESRGEIVNCTNINASNSILKLYEPHSITDSEAKVRNTLSASHFLQYVCAPTDSCPPFPSAIISIVADALILKLSAISLADSIFHHI